MHSFASDRTDDFLHPEAGLSYIMIVLGSQNHFATEVIGWFIGLPQSGMTYVTTLEKRSAPNFHNIDFCFADN